MKFLPLCLFAFSSTIVLAQVSSVPTTVNELDSIKGEIKSLKRQLKEIKAKEENDKIAEDEKRKNAEVTVQANFPVVNLKGAVEVEASSRQSYHGTYSDDILNFTAMMGANAQVHELVAADLSLLYEEDSTALEVDEAFITYGSTESLFLKAGRFYLPLADMSSGFVSDSMTRTLTEIRESSVSAGASFMGLTFEAFAFRGDAKKANKGPRIRDFGASLLYQAEVAGIVFTPRLGHLKNGGDIIAIESALTDVDGDGNKNDLAKYSPVTTASMGIEFASFKFFGEWAKLRAFRKEDLAFKDAGAGPSAFTLETSYQIPVGGISLSPMVGHQRSRESVKLSLPKTRTLVGMNLAISEQAGLVYEYNRSKDYTTSECDISGGTCGTSKKASAHIVKLSATF